MPTKKPSTTPPKFAAGTKVSSSESIEQIKATLRKFGATGFAQAEDESRVALLFVIAGGTKDERRVRFSMNLPGVMEFAEQKRGFMTVKRTASETIEAHKNELNRKWRALSMGIKAKLVLVEENVETLEEAFYANIVLPDNSTIYESTRAHIAEAYERKLMPPALLPALPAKKEDQ